MRDERLSFYLNIIVIRKCFFLQGVIGKKDVCSAESRFWRDKRKAVAEHAQISMV